MYEFSIEKNLLRRMRKILKKDKKLYESLMKKIGEIINSENISHYKNLKKPLQDFKRVHIRGSFVLIFKINNKENKIIFYDLDHHDNIYQKNDQTR